MDREDIQKCNISYTWDAQAIKESTERNKYQ